MKPECAHPAFSMPDQGEIPAARAIDLDYLRNGR
jgi:hypothetical protein